METFKSEIVVPTAEEVDALQGIADPGEQLVAYYSARERLETAYQQEQRAYNGASEVGEWLNSDDIEEYRESTDQLKDLGEGVFSQMLGKFATAWSDRKVHVEAIDLSTKPVDTYRDSFWTSDFEDKFINSRAAAEGKINSALSVPLLPHVTTRLIMDQNRPLRLPLIHKTRIVEHGTGNPLVHVEFGSKK